MRVKAGADEATAKALRLDLESLGAVVSVEDAGPSAPLPTAAPPARPAAPPSPPTTAPPGARPPPPGGFESGLGAAFRASNQVSLGALDSVDTSDKEMGSFRLGALDGSDDEPVAPAPAPVYTPPGKTVPPLDTGVAPQSMRREPEDPFASPSEEGEAMLELAESPAKKKKASVQMAPIPPPSRSSQERAPVAAPRPSAQAAAQPSQAVGGPADGNAFGPPPDGEDAVIDVAAPPPRRTKQTVADAPAADTVPTPPPFPVRAGGGGAAVATRGRPFEGKPRARVLAGLALGLLLGFAAAHLYAGSAEEKYVGIRRTGEAETAAITQEDYAHHLQLREDAITALAAAHKRVTIVSAIIWLAVGGVAAYAFFRFVPED